MTVKTFPFTISTLGTKMKICVFLVDNVLIDTGPSRIQKKVVPIIKDLSFEKVVLTHHHEDHSGNASWIQNHLNKPIYVHSIGMELCEQKSSLPPYRALFWGNRPGFSVRELPRVVKTKHHELQVVHTPGHAEDHVCLVDEDNQLCFTGDLYLHHTPLSMFRFESIPEIMSSLKRILQYSFKDIYCSHKGIIPNGRQVLIRKLTYLEEISDEIETQYNEGNSLTEIRNNLFPRNTLFQYISLFENSPNHIVQSVLSEYIKQEK
ncbi:MBL fold metallo-hydrolase [Bacillus spongiae]|uniref:MBL fold metallo-hydrolase n=1 Tax=Bacillus spongiae TaxID=2683610 RepID=A0ABU8HB22_9BACI